MALDINAARGKATRAVKSFSPQQLLILGGLTIVSIMGLIALMRWVSQPTYSVIMAGANATEITKATDALDGAGLTYQLSANGTGLSVANQDVAAAKLAVGGAGVNLTGEVEGYGILDKQGLTTSEFQQRVDLQRALEGQITNMLLQMDAVATAKVQLSIPEKALFTDEQEPTRASVLISTNGSIDSSAVRAIMQTVASAVPNLQADNVTVTDTSGRILSVDGMSAGDDPMQLARKFEAATASQAQTMLDRILGSGKSVVRVSAQMDLDQTESKQTTYDTTPVVVASQVSKESYTGGNGTSAEAGVVGVTGVTLSTTTENGAAGTGDGQDYTKEDTASSNAVGSTETVTKGSGGKVKRLSVAVAVDQTALQTAGADAEAVRSLVIAAVGADVGAVADGGRGDTVEVQAQPFDVAGTDAADEAAKAAASAQSKESMVGYAKTGGAIVVLLLAVLFLRKGLKSRGQDEVDEVDTAVLTARAELLGVGGARGAIDGGIARTSLAARPASLAVGAGEGDDASAADRRALDPAAEVLDLIDREPEDVAALLRSWVADRRS